MYKPRARMPLLALTLLVSSSAVLAQAPPGPRPGGGGGASPRQLSPGAAPGARPGGGGEIPATPDKEIDEVVKEYEKIDGLFTLYRKKKNASDSILMEVPEAKLGKLYLLQATAASGLAGAPGGIFQGSPLGDVPFRMDLVDDSRVLLVQPNLSQRAPSDKEMARTIGRTFPETILRSLEIKARQKDRKSVLLDVTEFFKSDISGVTARLAGGGGPAPDGPRGGGAGGGLALDSGFTFIDSLKSFPENLVVRTQFKLNRSGPGGAGRAVPFAVSYNLSKLPEDDGYLPRLADPRVGFFTVNYDDLSDPQIYDDNVSFIQRWRLEKADPSLPLSPPKKPIKFYIDNGVPLQYRDAVRAGLLAYNKAFEAVGIKDAIVVEQMPDNADWDIADVRYNIIRWTTGQPFAIALFRANPLTGEILNAAINMDAVFATGGAESFDTTINPRKFFALQGAPAGSQGYAPEAQQTAEAGHEGHSHGPLPGAEGVQCTYLADSAMDAHFGMTALGLLAAPGKPFNKDAFVKQRITQVVAHEMGHCLGLRHNFIASTEMNWKQLSDPAYVSQQGVATTMMDYLPWNLAAIKRTDVPFFSQTVGSYDLFAIQYGYSPVPGAKTPREEMPALRKIAAKGSTAGHRFHTDGVADSYDPYISRFDFSADPLEYVTKRLQVSRSLLLTLPQRLPKQGESYYEYTRAFDSLLNSYFGALGFASRFVGGMRIGNSYKGDTNGTLPLKAVDGAEQKRALDLMNRYVFNSRAFAFPKGSFDKLTPNPNSPREASAEARRYPMLDRFSDFQAEALASVFDPYTLNRVANNEYRAGADTLTLATLYRSVGGEVWSELTTGAEIDPLRRNLQRAHLDLLIRQVSRRNALTPRDADALAWEQLRGLRAKIAKSLPAAKGEYARPHLEESLMRIDRVMKATPLLAEG